MSKQLKNPAKRIACAVVAGCIHSTVEDDCEMGNLSHLVGLGPGDMEEIKNELLLIANKLEDKSGLPERRIEWRDALMDISNAQ
jgi:hypothetical protein